MAKTTQLSYSLAMTINTGNYSSVKLEASEVVALEPNDDPKLEQQALIKRVKRVIAKESLAYGTESN